MADLRLIKRDLLAWKEMLGSEKKEAPIEHAPPTMRSGGLLSHTTGSRVELGPDQPERLSSSETYRRIIENMDAAGKPVDFNRL